MIKAGGIIALIAGIFGVIAALATLLIGGVGSALDGEGAETVIGLGWGGVLFSFLVIIFGVVSLMQNQKHCECADRNTYLLLRCRNWEFFRHQSVHNAPGHVVPHG